LLGAIVHGEVVASLDGTVIGVHGLGGPGTPFRAEKDGETIVLPSATIKGVSPIGGEYVAWDGERYVVRPTAESILADSRLMLVGPVKRVSNAVAKPAEHATAAKPTVKVPTAPKRLSSLIHSPSAAQKMQDYMNRKGLNQTEFGIQAQTSDKTIRKFIKTGKVKRSILVGIAAAMRLSKEDLLS
jgi:hypothetical protein